MNDLAQVKGSYQAHFSQIGKERQRHAEGWVPRIRDQAMSRFSELGFPSARDEEWKYTNVAPIAETSFRPASGDANGITAETAARLSPGGMAAWRLVFVNGRYSAALSSPKGPAGKVEIGSLAAVLKAGGDSIEPYLARYADYERHAFVALNTALMEDGAVVRVPPREVVEVPIHLLFISRPEQEPVVSHPRILIVIGESSQASIVESYEALGEGVYFSNAVTEIVVGENSAVDHYKLQRESEQAYHIATLQAYQTAHSHFSSHSIVLGGALVRNDINVVLDAEGCECTLNGLYLASGKQHVDNHTRIDHARPHGTSRELYKGILGGKARGVFNGKIYVHKAAEKTDAKQTNKNLLLSQDAWVDTKPQLEIYNNDVKCSHGSTIGQLDQDALFYLRSRGLGVGAARSLLTYAFASDIINRIGVGAIRAELDSILAVKFGADSLAREER